MKHIFLGIIFSAVSWGAEYIVPPEFDNTVLATESSKRELITNTSPATSSAPRTIGGKTVKYKCVTVPKIQCRGKSAQMLVNTSEISLRDPTNKLVNIYTFDAFAESANATTWKVCGGAVGGTTWDKTNFTQSGNFLVYTYDENAEQKIYHFFTDVMPATDHGHNSSFMVVDTKQVCI